MRCSVVFSCTTPDIFSFPHPIAALAQQSCSRNFGSSNRLSQRPRRCPQRPILKLPRLGPGRSPSPAGRCASSIWPGTRSATGRACRPRVRRVLGLLPLTLSTLPGSVGALVGAPIGALAATDFGCTNKDADPLRDRRQCIGRISNAMGRQARTGSAVPRHRYGADDRCPSSCSSPDRGNRAPRHHRN